MLKQMNDNNITLTIMQNFIDELIETMSAEEFFLWIDLAPEEDNIEALKDRLLKNENYEKLILLDEYRTKKALLN